MVMPNASFPNPADLADIPDSSIPGDNTVRLVENPGAGSTGFVFEFAIAPEEKIDFKGDQRIAEIGIPSADGAILQPIGSEPTRARWHGVFEDVFDSGGGLVRRAVDDVQTLEDMRISGKVWIFKYLDLTILTMIKSFNYSPVSPNGLLNRFEYDLELIRFYPNLGFDRPQTVTAFVQNKDQQSALSGIRGFFANITAAVQLVADEVTAVSNFILTPYRDFVGLLNDVFDQLEATGSIINETIANAALAVTTPQRDLELLQQRIDDNVTVLQQMQANIIVVNQASAGFQIALKDLETNLQFLQQLPQLQPTPPITYTVIEGDRIEDIAELFYGDFEVWRIIADANNLTNPAVLTPGQVLKIPQ